MEFLVAWFVQLLVSIILLWGIGSWLAEKLLPPTSAIDVVLTAPFFGLAAVSSICIYLGTVGLAVHQFAWILLGVAIIGGVVTRRQLGASLRHHWRVLVICLAAYGLVMWPLIQLGYFTTLGGTIDAISYATRSEYLQIAGLAKPAAEAGRPALDWVAAHIDYLRVGDVYFVSVVSALSGARSYQLLTAIAGLFFALTPASVYLFSRRSLHLKQRAALIAAGLTGIHNLLLWAVYDNFLSQTLAVSLFPVVLSAGLSAIRTRGRRETVGFAALLTGLISVYPIYGVPVVAGCLGYGLLVILRDVKRRAASSLKIFKRYVTWSAGLTASILVWNGLTVWRAYKELLFIGTLLGPQATSVVGPGNITVFTPVSALAGLVAHANAAYQLGAWQLPEALIGIGIATWATGLAVGWWKLKPEARWISAMALGVTVGMALQQRFLIDPPNGYAYGYFKIASLIVLAAIPVLAQAIAWSCSRPRVRYVVWPLSLALVGLNLANSGETIQYVLKDRVVIDRTLIDIAEGVRHIPAGTWIQLDVRPGLTQNWIAYLLKDQRLHFREPPLLWNWVIQAVDPTTVYQYSLVDKAVEPARMQRSILDEPWYDSRGYTVSWQNAVYELRQRNDAALADVHLDADHEDWEPNEILDISSDVTGRRLYARLGTRPPVAGMLAGRPRQLQLITVVAELAAELRVDDARLPLERGVWLVTVSLSATDQIRIQNTSAASIYLHRIQAFDTPIEAVMPKVTAELQSEGAAIVAQAVTGDVWQYTATLIRPRGDQSSIYRLGLHVIELATSQPFGTWGLNFAGPDQLQHGKLLFNPRNRTAQGFLDEVEVSVDVGPRTVKQGSFEAQVVWWRLDAEPVYFSLCHCVRFTRIQGGQVDIQAMAKRAPITIIPPS
jgi:hypothetical protein